MPTLIPSAPPAAQGPSAVAKPEDPSASPTKQQAELQEIAESWERTAEIQWERARLMGHDEPVANGHHNLALAYEACAKQLLSALSAVSSKEEEKGN